MITVWPLGCGEQWTVSNARERYNRRVETCLRNGPFWTRHLDDAQPDTFLGRDSLIAHVKCRRWARQPPSRVGVVEFEFGVAEIYAGAAAGVDRAVFPISGGTVAATRVQPGSAP